MYSVAITINGQKYALTKAELREHVPYTNLYPIAVQAGTAADRHITAHNGESIMIGVLEYQVNHLPQGLELVALADWAEDDEAPAFCSACGAPMDDGDPLRAFCPNGPHTWQDFERERGF